MPADARALGVTRDEYLGQLCGLALDQGGGALAQPPEPLGQRLHGHELSAVVVVAEPEVANRALGRLAAHLDLAKVQRLDQLEQLTLLLWGDEVVLVEEALYHRLLSSAREVPWRRPTPASLGSPSLA